MTLTSWFTHNSLRRPRFVLVTHGTVQSPSRHKLSTLKIFSRVVNTVQWLATMTHDSSTGRLENNHPEYTTTEPFKWPAKWRHQLLCIRPVSLNYHTGLRPVIQILCHDLAWGWGHWLRYFTEAKAKVKYRASTQIRGPKHDTRFEGPVSILIMTGYPFLPFKTHKTSAKNPRLLMINGAIWFCHHRHSAPSQFWMHAPVAKERPLMTSQYHVFDHTDNLNPQWMQAVNG